VSLNLTATARPARHRRRGYDRLSAGFRGVKPFLGRGFEHGEERLGEHRVVVLTTHGESQFGGDPACSTQDQPRRFPFSVIGVLHRGLSCRRTSRSSFPSCSRTAPWRMAPDTAWPRPPPDEIGVTLAQAEAELAAPQPPLYATLPSSARTLGGVSVSCKTQLRRCRAALLLLLGAVALVLLIARNVANLLLARRNVAKKKWLPVALAPASIALCARF